MKKITLLLLTLIISTSAFAQIGYGVKAGINTSTIVNNGAGVKTNWRVGFVGGAFVDYRFNEVFALEFDALYSQQGVRKFKIATGTEDIDFKSNLDYMVMPLIAKFYPLERMHINLGPQLACLVREKYTNNINAKAMTSDTNKAVLDMVFGTGYEFDCGFMLDLRYTLGLTYTYKAENNTRVNKNRNSVLQLTAGWRF